MTQQTFSPIDGRLLVERQLPTIEQIDETLKRAKAAQASWRATPVEERVAICGRFADAMVANRDLLGNEITRQMGRPMRYSSKEIDTMANRARFMSGAAQDCLSDILLEPLPGFHRFIRREPLGLVFAIMPWNYPYLTAVNAVVPALLSGNTVLLKHSPHTPLAAERIAQAFGEAGLPDGVFQFLHLTPEQADSIVRRPEVDFISFTGSVAVGRKVQAAASEKFIGVGLELGGKDPAYVRPDADLGFTVENVLDGAYFNSGQSCCAIERIYVHERIFDEFIERAVSVAESYVLGNPLDPSVTLGPMVRAFSADFVREQIAEAVSQGARSLIDESSFPFSRPRSPYMAPQIVVDVDHSMRIMTEESFGPVVGVMPVDGDEEAVRLMNDSHFGLTASVWTADPDAGLALADKLEAGTVFMNRCDHLDPELPWVGVKNSGHGCTLSRLGFDYLTRPKSFHLRIQS